MGVKIKDLPELDRPIERLILKGANNLSDTELIAIILKTGTKNKSSKELAESILCQIKNIQELNNIRINNLTNIKGIGIHKASNLVAAIELGKRINIEAKPLINKTYSNVKEIYHYYKNIFKDKKQEYFYVMYLDTKLKIIENKMLFKGTLNHSLIHPREIFKEAYLLSANSIICVHNHPSGNPIPSDDDIIMTKNLKSIGYLLGIKLLDHVIIGFNNYYSFKENGDI